MGHGTGQSPERFVHGEAITRAAHARPYDRAVREPADPRDPDPSIRKLTVYTQDPATPRMYISTADAIVPFEPLKWGPEGDVVKVIDANHTTGELYDAVDLDAFGVAAPTGLPPSTTDPRFAQQMTYAVAMVTYDRFRQALGRTPDFAFDALREGEPADPGGRVKLHVYPHAMQEDNAYYDPDRGALLFGYTFANAKAGGANQKGSVVYTSLSHDVVVHEMTHAMLDGMRSHFMLPSNADVSAFHEGFSDLVALFQRFQFRQLVERAIEDAPADLASRLLTDMARQWGQTTGSDGKQPLRSALVDAGSIEEPVKAAHRYGSDKEAHDLGAVLVAAVYDAFRWIFTQKTRNLRRLAGPSPSSRELVEMLASSACRIAGQFLNILIRAVDYCPPVDVTFGEFLRAMITADYDLIPDDPWGYRDAMVQAFRRYGIEVDGVRDLSERALLWRAPEVGLRPIEKLAFSNLQHGNDPGHVPDADELKKRADVLGEFVTRPEHHQCFGLTRPDAQKKIDVPRVESIRTLRRIAGDNTVTFDQVAEIVQCRRLSNDLWFYGGSTVVIDANGRVRYSIVKHVTSKDRERRFRKHVEAWPDDADFFRDRAARKSLLLQRLHRLTRP